MASLIKKKKTFQETVKDIDTTQKVNADLETQKVQNTLDTKVIPTGETIRGKPELNVKQGDKTYPTTNPDFTPNPDATDIKFNQDNTVTISPKGTTEKINLTKEEYNTFKGEAGNVTDKVQQAENMLNPKERFTTDIPTEQTLQDNTMEMKDLRGTTTGKVLSTVADFVDTISSTLPISGLKLKDPQAVNDVKDGFNKMNDVVNEDIKLYLAGQKSLSEVERDMEKQIEFTNKLYRLTKGKGQVNLAFWRDQGASLEAEALRQIRVIENQKRSLGL